MRKSIVQRPRGPHETALRAKCGPRATGWAALVWPLQPRFILPVQSKTRVNACIAGAEVLNSIPWLRH